MQDVFSLKERHSCQEIIIVHTYISLTFSLTLPPPLSLPPLETSEERRARKRKSRWGDGDGTTSTLDTVPLLGQPHLGGTTAGVAPPGMALPVALGQSHVGGTTLGVPPPGVAIPVALGQPVPMPQKTINVVGKYQRTVSLKKNSETFIPKHSLGIQSWRQLLPPMRESQHTVADLVL